MVIFISWVSLRFWKLIKLQDPYLGAGVTVVETVVALGIRRNELQNEVAGLPSAFKTPKQPVMILQFTARGTSAFSEAKAEHEAAGI